VDRYRFIGEAPYPKIKNVCLSTKKTTPALREKRAHKLDYTIHQRGSKWKGDQCSPKGNETHGERPEKGGGSISLGYFSGETKAENVPAQRQKGCIAGKPPFRQQTRNNGSAFSYKKKKSAEGAHSRKENSAAYPLCGVIVFGERSSLPQHPSNIVPGGGRKGGPSLDGAWKGYRSITGLTWGTHYLATARQKTPVRGSRRASLVGGGGAFLALWGRPYSARDGAKGKNYQKGNKDKASSKGGALIPQSVLKENEKKA